MQKRGLGGGLRLKSGEPAAVPTAVGVQKTETWLGPPKHYRKYIATSTIENILPLSDVENKGSTRGFHDNVVRFAI